MLHRCTTSKLLIVVYNSDKNYFHAYENELIEELYYGNSFIQGEIKVPKSYADSTTIFHFEVAGVDDITGTPINPNIVVKNPHYLNQIFSRDLLKSDERSTLIFQLDSYKKSHPFK